MDERYIVLAVLHMLMRNKEIKADLVQEAIKDLDIDPDKANPMIS